jgi:hypothetical protein
MARVDYYSLEEAIKRALEADEDLRDQAVIEIEATVVAERDRPVVIIHLDRRDAPSDLQTLSAGQRTRFRCRFVLACYAYALELAQLLRLRDDLVGKVEIALQRAANQSILTDAGFEMCFLEGGEFETPAKSGEGWELGAEVVLAADVTSRTV